MALSSTPSLVEINTELGTSGQSLVTCIANAGKTGTWTAQSQFANYSAASIVVTPSSGNALGFDTSFVITIAASSAWERYGVLPSWVTSVSPESGTGTTSTAFFPANLSGIPRDGTISYRLQSDTGITDSIFLTQQPA